MKSDLDQQRIFLSPPDVGPRERELLLEAFDSNYIAPVGPFLTRFEELFREKTGFEHAVAVSSGSAALHLALHHLGVGPGDVVLASTLTFIGSVGAARHLGAELVFVDSDRETWNLDADLLKRAIEELVSGGKTPRAVIPTELYGQPSDVSRLREVCEPHGIPIVIDAAEALGSSFGGKCVGLGADAAAFSFNGNKILTTSGGGILASDDFALIEHASYLSTQAREPVVHFEHREVGYNFRLSNLLAAVGVGQLESLEEKVAKKRKIFDFYRARLGEVPGIEFMPETEGGTGNRWLTVILVDEERCGAGPEEIRLALEAENIESRPLWKPMHLQPVFASNRVFGGEVADDLYRRGLCLPSGTSLLEGDLERIVDTMVGAVRVT